MATGNTTTGSLADSLPSIRNSARIVREYEGVMPKVVDRYTLGEGEGLSWSEISLSQLSAQSVTENTDLDNPQQLVDSLFSVTPVISGVHTIITDRVRQRIDRKALARIGVLSQNAIQRKKDEDGIAVLDGATTSLAGAGVTLTSGHVSAGVSRVKHGGGTEPSTGDVHIVLQPFQIKDLMDEIVAGVGTYLVPAGLSDEVYRRGYVGTVKSAFGANLWSDGNITVDSSDDAKGGIFAREAIVLVQGHSPRTETQRRPQTGGGADALWIYDEYAYGERSAGNWLFEIYSDATSPTS